MSITTYAELITAIGAYLARSDLSAYLGDFVVAAETRLAFGSKEPFQSEPLRIRAMETEATLTPSAGYLTLPTGFLALRSIYETGSPKKQLEQTGPEDFYRKYGGSTSGSAKFYTILGEKIILGPSGTSDCQIVYHKKFDPVATASPVPWLLTNAPHVYVYGALLESAPFLRNDARLQIWHGMFRSVVNALNSSNKTDRWGGSVAAVRSDAGSP